MRPLCTVKQKSPTHAKESTRDATTNLRQVHGREGQGEGKGREEAEKVWLVFFFSWLFFRVTGSGKMCEMLLTISFNFKLISANCLAVNAAESHALPGSESHRVTTLPCSTLLCQVPDEFLSLSSHSHCHCRRQALRSLQFCYRNSHMHARLLRLGRAP